jgi:hypothetical protein
LGIVTAKENPNKVISYLEGIEGQKAAYIRGFAHAHLGNWQQANREWKSIHDDAVDSQREIVRCLAERDRLMRIREIEKQIDKGCPLLAKSASLKFIEKFGSDSIVQTNLEEHIQPSLEHQIWNTKDWGVIATKTEQIWLEKQDITSLHNWAIATYYQAQKDANKLADFIVAWSTALANIEINPALKNVSWLGSTSIDLKDVSSKLKQILENSIDAVKDNDINEYLRLRDIYRRDMVSLRYGENSSIPVGVKVIPVGVRVNRMFISPGCYQRHQHKLTAVTFPIENLYSKSTQAALYTDWGLAVAACLEKDTARAIQIKPVKHPSSQADRFAYSFVSYHEGCYHLQNLDWRKAINPLQQAKADIKAESDWCKEIDRLCELHRKKIDNLDEHLQFSQFWYELLNSQPGRSYFAECKARTVAQKLDDKKISLQQGLDELQKVGNIDPSNSVTLNLIEKVEINLELEKINRLWEQSQFEEAVRLAKRSRHETVRFTVAQVCLEILLKGVQRGSLPFEVMHQLGRWAYELCPHEPAFKPLYSQLGIYR